MDQHNIQCIMHAKCGGVVAPNLSVIPVEELLEMTIDFLPVFCWKCGAEVRTAEDLEIEGDQDS